MLFTGATKPYFPPADAASETTPLDPGTLLYTMVLHPTHKAAGAPNPFCDPTVAAHYLRQYHAHRYRGRHLVDADLVWLAAADEAITAKVDWSVTGWAFVMFMGLQIDRTNLSQALSDGFLTDIGVSTNQYNTGKTIFFLSFLLSELPAAFLVKRAGGPSQWIPWQITLWLVVVMAQLLVYNKTLFYLTRLLLGVLEGGFIPIIVMWLTKFYTLQQLPIRLLVFWSTGPLANVLLAVLAYGLLRLRGVWGLAGWQYLFVVEGACTLVIGLLLFGMMAELPLRPRRRWLDPPGGFLAPLEVEVLVNRVLRDDPMKGLDETERERAQDLDSVLSEIALAISTKSTPAVHTPLEVHDFMAAIGSPDLWPIYLLGFITFIPLGTVSDYLLLNLVDLGFSTLTVNLLLIPYNVVYLALLIAITRLLVWSNQRLLAAMAQPLWSLPALLVLLHLLGSTPHPWMAWALMLLLLGAPYVHAIYVGWCSQNTFLPRQRAVTTTVYNICVQLGRVAASNIFREDDMPGYPRGYRVLTTVSVLTVVLLAATNAYYQMRNRDKLRAWNAMDESEREEYRATAGESPLRLDFRFVY